MLKIFLAKDFYYLQSQGVNAQRHRHAAPQISVVGPQDELFWGSEQGGGLFFPPECPHAVESPGMIHTFFLNPVHPAARAMAEKTPAEGFFRVPQEVRRQLTGLQPLPDSGAALRGCLDLLLGELVDSREYAEPLDERIREVVDSIDRLEQKRIAAEELAKQIALSESRFLHLFKEEMKMTLRKYLLWTRVLEGARRVALGESITEAAHATGFTDSAHFARSFKKMFGLTLSGALGQEADLQLVMEGGVASSWGAATQRKLE